MAKTIINAAKAKELLANNDHNRKLSPTRIRKFADEMQNGMWVYNGESIIVSESGRLLDGQHRLHAIANSGAEVELELIENVPDQDNGVDTFLTINTENRNNSDALWIDGFKTDTPQIAKLMSFKEAFNSQRLLQKTSGIKLLNHEAVELAREFTEKEALRVIDRARTLAKRCDLLALNYWILAVYVFEQLDKGNMFLEALAECDSGQARNGNPVHAYINLLKQWKNGKVGGNAISRGKWLGMFKAYDAMIHDKKIKIMRVSRAEPLDYPTEYENYQD